MSLSLKTHPQSTILRLPEAMRMGPTPPPLHSLMTKQETRNIFYVMLFFRGKLTFKWKTCPHSRIFGRCPTPGTRLPFHPPTLSNIYNIFMLYYFSMEDRLSNGKHVPHPGSSDGVRHRGHGSLATLQPSPKIKKVGFQLL